MDEKLKYHILNPFNLNFKAWISPPSGTGQLMAFTHCTLKKSGVYWHFAKKTQTCLNFGGFSTLCLCFKKSNRSLISAISLYYLEWFWTIPHKIYDSHISTCKYSGIKFLIFRFFFEADATENNKIPVVNKNLSSQQVLFYYQRSP